MVDKEAEKSTVEVPAASATTAETPAEKTQPPSEQKKKPIKDVAAANKKIPRKKLRPSTARLRHADTNFFSNQSIVNLSRSLAPNEWVKLAYALGFLPQGISNFTGQASSAQNQYSQCVLMLVTWRDNVPREEILPRLCSALQRIRRTDLAVKSGLEIAVHVSNQNTSIEADHISALTKYISKNAEGLFPPHKDSEKVFSNVAVSFLARKLLKREEWKWLAYALGFLPDDVSQIIASASSSHNLYAQAHLMLLQWRDRTPPDKIVPALRKAFVRTRRHDLVFMQKLGYVTTLPEGGVASVEQKIDELERETKQRRKSLGDLILTKFKSPKLQQVIEE